MLRCAKALRRLRGKCGALARDARGIAAVEFSLILPLMLLLYFGSVLVTQGVRANRKVDLVAAALANLTSQQLTCSTGGSVPCLTETDMTGSNGIFTAAAAIMAPYATSDLKMTVSQVNVQTYNGGLIAKVDWTVTNNGGTARPCSPGGANNSLIAQNVSTSQSTFQKYIPTSYVTSGAPTGSMIIADVVYQFKPGMGWNMFQWSDTTTVFRMANVGYFRNRNSTSGSAGPITPTMTSGVTDCP